MKFLVFFIIAIFFNFEDVQSSPMIKSNTEQQRSSSPEQFQQLHGSTYPPDTATTNPLINAKINFRNSPSKQQKQQRRFRRSFGYKTQCLPVKKIRCKAFTVGRIKKNFCLEYVQIVCTALDWLVGVHFIKMRSLAILNLFDEKHFASFLVYLFIRMFNFLPIRCQVHLYRHLIFLC